MITPPIERPGATCGRACGEAETIFAVAASLTGGGGGDLALYFARADADAHAAWIMRPDSASRRHLLGIYGVTVVERSVLAKFRGGRETF